MDYELFELGDVTLQSGTVLRDARLAYSTHGTLNAAGDNAVLMPTFYTGTNTRNEGFFGPGRALDPERHYIISVNLFGNGRSSSPSNAAPPQDGPRFPNITYFDNVACQHRLLTEHLGVTSLALVVGWSMAAAQSFQWGAQYPDMVKAILPFCGSAKTSPHNFVFLEGVKAALMADSEFKDGDYDAQPEKGLKAFGVVYAGWAFSQTFYREGLYRQCGFDSVAALLKDWEDDHYQNWDANNLLAKLWTWQRGDISANEIYEGDFRKALGAIKARAIVMPCKQDLYFPPADNEIEVSHMPNAELRVYDSPFGHCAPSPGNDAGFTAALDQAISELLN
ncbi:MAG: alpha/beta fold hydrolase [Alphaproteobacteria bacterium]